MCKPSFTHLNLKVVLLIHYTLLPFVINKIVELNVLKIEQILPHVEEILLLGTILVCISA